MIFHNHCASGCALVKHASEIELWWHESNCIDRKNTQEIEFDGQNLIGASDFHWYTHCKLFIFINGWFLILLDQIPLACLQDAPIRLQFGPYLELTFPLYETKCRVEFYVRFEVLREEKLDFHE